jgi:hypothetical protein
VWLDALTGKVCEGGRIGKHRGVDGAPGQRPPGSSRSSPSNW